MIDPAEHIGLAYHAADILAELFGGGGEDWLGFAFEEIANAARRFDDSNGAKFSTYAMACVRRRGITEAHKRKGGQFRKVGSDKQAWAYLRIEGGSDASEPPATSAPDWDGAPEALEAAMSELAPRAAAMLTLRMRGAKLDQIGREFGCSRERARQIVEKAIAKLRRILAKWAV